MFDFDYIAEFRWSDCLMLAGALAVVFNGRLRRAPGLCCDLRDPEARLGRSEMRELVSASFVAGVIVGLLVAAAGLWIMAA